MNSFVSRFAAAFLASALFGSVCTFAQVQFEDVSSQTGMKGFTETWGGSWGDINSDGWPDLINQGHREYPRIHRNNGEGGFQDIAYETDPGNWINFVFDDKHGVSFADFDNDGDDDMMFAVSATGNAQFFVNTDGNGTFVDRAADSGLLEDEAARLGVWFDYNNDGHLDVAQAYTKNGFLRYRDPDDATFPDVDFDEEAWAAGWFCAGKLNYLQLIDLDGDGTLEILCMQEGVFPVKAYDYTTFPFTDVTGSLPVVSNINDTAVADFDGDLLYDMVMTRGAMRPSGATLVNDNRIEFWVRKDDDAPPGKGIDFETAGPITVTIDHKDMGIYESSKVFEMAPDGVTYIEIIIDRSPLTLTVEYVPADEVWQVRVVEVERSFQAYLQIDTTAPVTSLTEVDFDAPEAATETFHLKNGPGGLTPVYDTGLYFPKFCVSVVAGDFDNDMDQDLYLVCRRGPDNLTNRYFDNQGDGTFVEVINHGAEGPVGTGFEFGTGESAVIADYDVDGFLDIYVTNGLLFYPVNVGGPDNLFRNQGNANHWLEIDLNGTTSNRDGIGAKVYVTAGGVTQLREQNGGYHRWSQNHRRLHVGLGANTQADVMIEWPSGQVDNFTAVAADALYRATEGGTMDPVTLGPPVYTTLQAGDECGEPPYDYDYGPAVLLWKDCGTGVWSLRAKGGRETDSLLHSAGRITADADFTGVTPVALGASDELEAGFPGLLVFDVGAWYSNDKGFDFSTAGQTTSCFGFDVQDIPVLIVGGSRKRITGGFDLVTLAPCDLPPPPPPLNLTECGEPTFDNATENGLFAWRDCDIPTTAFARWNFSMSAGGLPWQPYPGLIYSNTTITATGIGLEPNDTLDEVVGDDQVEFVLNVADNGVDGFQIDVPTDAITCLDSEQLPAGTPVLVGESRTPLAIGNTDLLTLETCDGLCHP